MNTKISLRMMLLLMLISTLILSFSLSVNAAEKNETTGWDKGSRYDNLYDNENRDAFRGYLKKIIHVVPMKGMTEGVGLIVEDSEDGELVTVQLGPDSFVEPVIDSFKVGSIIQIYGVLAEIDGEYSCMCAQIMTADKEYRFRNSDGIPLWSTPARKIKTTIKNRPE